MPLPLLVKMPEQHLARSVAVGKSQKRAKRSSSARSAGSVCVCSSLTICSQSSTVRRVGGFLSYRALTSIQQRELSRVVRVSRSRRRGLRPPAINCWVCAKNSISRIPRAAELDIVAFDGDFAVPTIGVDLAFGAWRARRQPRRSRDFCTRERAVVEDRLARRDETAAGPRLNQRGALPILSSALVVRKRRRGGDHERGRGRGRRRRRSAQNT